MSRSPAAPVARPRSYDEKRDFNRTPEPRARRTARQEGSALFVVQKHDARRLHWDFRLEHGGVLWSWAVPKGPSMDPGDKRLAVHVEDHPVDYARFEGTIPQGNYGAGTVELWDQGHWQPKGEDPAADLARGELKFTLDGNRLRGGFVLVRLKPRPRERAENWLLIKEHDEAEARGLDAAALERARPKRAAKAATTPAAPPGANPAPARRPVGKSSAGKPPVGKAPAGRPAAGSEVPQSQAPQLATLVTSAPEGEGWISEIKFDGYRMLCRKAGDAVRLLSRNGLDWTARVPELAKAVAALPAPSLMLDGELVALQRDGRSSFALLQKALSDEHAGDLLFYAFDLLHLDGTDLRPLPLKARKQALEDLLDRAAQTGPIRLSEHLTSEAAQVRSEACKAGLEGIVCKRLDSPYRAGRGRDWLKLKCEDREEFVILGFTPPKGSRQHLGSLLMGRRDEDGTMRFAGGVGTGFDAASLRLLHDRLAPLALKTRPKRMANAENAPRDAVWVRPELVAEIRFGNITPDGMLRHATFLGLREDKPAEEVVARPPADAAATDAKTAEPEDAEGKEARPKAVTVRASAPKSRGSRTIGSQRLTHPDRVLWPETEDGPAVTKADLAQYWQTVADQALSGIARRPLAFVRCPDGIEGEHFFQKHRSRGMPDALREGSFDEAPYLALDDEVGLLAATQMSVIELHSWGSRESRPGEAERLVFDLDPGDDVPFAAVVEAAHDVRERLKRLGLIGYARTSGGKGLHVVAPVETSADWDAVRGWCRRFAETMEREAPKRYVSTTRKDRRRGKILVDWLRNGLGSTAIASYSPRARPGATVAAPLAWPEVTDQLEPRRFTIHTIPERLERSDPWRRFEADRHPFNPSK